MKQNQKSNLTKQDLILKKIQQLAQCNMAVLKSYGRFFEHWKDPVLIVNTAGSIVFFNKAAEEMTGYVRDEVTERHFRMFLTLDDLGDGFLLYYQTMKGCYSEHTKFRIRCKDGSTRVVDLITGPIEFDGKVRAALTIAKDVSKLHSQDPADIERVQIFKQFTQDLEKWNTENNRIRREVRSILENRSKPS